MTRFLALSFLVACSGGGPSADDTDLSEDSDTVTPETCDNGVDEDGNGLTDCADEECSSHASCAWPTQVHVDGVLFYDANWLAKSASVTDCTTHFTSDLTVNYPNDCTDCERIYTGTLTYVSDDCPADPNGAARPTQGNYGLVFTSATVWKAYWSNAGTWTLLGDATDNSTEYVSTSTETVMYEGNDVGDLTSTFKFNEI